ncbi:MAG: riboflavin synthase [Actinomycetota bacterium]|nr:riboflavin synthase [Actinomycetota bacterium]
MFTGIVEEVGHLREVVAGVGSTRVVVEAPLVAAGAAIGDSIALDGACLTVVDTGEGWWAADVVAETLSRTTLGSKAPGDPVNLERPMRPDGRFAGHLVQGHVDGVGEVVSVAPELVVRVPPQIAAYLVAKGSVTVDGCSLTVVEVTGETFSVAIVPHTAAVTTLSAKAVGDRVNLEVDVVAKYVERLVGRLVAPAHPAVPR